MSPATISNPAWLAVPPAGSLPEQVAAQIGPVARKIGFVPNVARLLAISPDHFTGWWRYFDELMRGPSGLSKTQREMIAVVVSAEARCPYCVAAHAAALRLRTKDPGLADRLAVNYRHVELPPRRRADIWHWDDGNAAVLNEAAGLRPGLVPEEAFARQTRKELLR